MEISTIVNDAHTRPAKFTSTFFGGDVSYRVRVSVRNLELCYSLKVKTFSVDVNIQFMFE
ncbi:hypothetical protein IC582_004922 [Cucumis melo]